VSTGKHYSNRYITPPFQKSLSSSFKSQLYRRLGLYNPLSRPPILKANLVAFIVDLVSLGSKDRIPLAYIGHI
jgi:hypothetical protein